MNTELFEKATRLNETLFEQVGKAAEMQMNAFRRYADVTMEQAKKDGLGAVALDGRLIDIASIKQAEVMVDKAAQIAEN